MIKVQVALFRTYLVPLPWASLSVFAHIFEYICRREYCLSCIHACYVYGIQFHLCICTIHLLFVVKLLTTDRARVRRQEDFEWNCKHTRARFAGWASHSLEPLQLGCIPSAKRSAAKRRRRRQARPSTPDGDLVVSKFTELSGRMNCEVEEMKRLQPDRPLVQSTAAKGGKGSFEARIRQFFYQTNFDLVAIAVILACHHHCRSVSAGSEEGMSVSDSVNGTAEDQSGGAYHDDEDGESIYEEEEVSSYA